MSNDVITDPEKIREFVAALSQYSKQVDNAFVILGHELSKLNNSWRDQEFMEFADYVKKSQTLLKKFTDEAGKITQKLERDAEKITAFQKLHIKY